MSAPRLKGTALRVLRALTGFGPVLALLRRKMFADHNIHRLLALGPEWRADYEIEPRPIAGAAPRAWHDAGLPAPEPAAWVVSNARLRAAYAAGRTTPSRVATALLAALDEKRLGHVTHSPFAALDREGFARAAAAADARWAAGAPLGPLDGIPVPVKDHYLQKGLPTRCGTAYMNAPATEDAELVQRLRAAGALLPGKTHVVEWGIQPTGYNPHFPMPRNVYAADRAAGGSSTGTAAAVALGLAPVGVGSDGGGSIRIPAYLHGAFGIKPTFERVSRVGDLWGHSTVAHGGPIGRSTADCVDFLVETAATPDPADPTTSYDPFRRNGELSATWRNAVGRGVKGARIGVWRRAFEATPRALGQPGADVLARLERDGAVLVDFDWPQGDLIQSLGVAVIGVETAAQLTDVLAEHAHETSDDLLINCRVLLTVMAAEYVNGLRTRGVLRRRTAAALAGVDVVVGPTAPVQAPYYGLDETGLSIFDDDATRGLTKFMFPANLFGLPAANAPVGMVNGLPAGVQIVGDAFDEASVIAVAAHVERTGAAHLPKPPGYIDLGGA